MTTTDTYTPEQESLVERLLEVTEEIGKAKAGVSQLHDTRRALIAEAYNAGLDTVQLGKVVKLSTEAVRKSLAAGQVPRRTPAKTK